MGHPHRLRQGGDPRHGHDDTDHPDSEVERLQERRQAEQRQGRRQERLRRRHLRLQRDRGQGVGRRRQRPRTHVSGIVGARGNNGLGVAGTCWSTKLVAVKFMNSKGKGSTSTRSTASSTRSRRASRSSTARSAPSSKSSSLHDAVDYAQDHGALLVVAAGNDGEGHRQEPGLPRLVHRLEHPGGGRHDVDRHAGVILELRRRDGRRRRSPATTSTRPTWAAATRRCRGPRWPRRTWPARPRCCASRSRTPPTASCARRCARRSTSRPPSRKVVYNGRLDVQKALAAIGSIVN